MTVKADSVPIANFTPNIMRDSATDSKGARIARARHCTPFPRLLVARGQRERRRSRARHTIPISFKDKVAWPTRIRSTAATARGEPADERRRSATIAQYIKDLSVESPSSPQVFQWQAQPQLDVQFNINVDKVADDVHEVVLKIEVARQVRQRRPFPDRSELRRPVRLPQHSRRKRCRRSCWSRRRACCSRSPARSSPTRSQNTRLPAAAARPDRLRRGLYGAAAGRSSGKPASRRGRRSARRRRRTEPQPPVTPARAERR